MVQISLIYITKRYVCLENNLKKQSLLEQCNFAIFYDLYFLPLYIVSIVCKFVPFISATQEGGCPCSPLGRDPCDYVRAQARSGFTVNSVKPAKS